ncbi:hypothetical protein BC939DRAFT_251781 [Gamsiella multidivaricata]|uniref:uncharacterized protein n=1 Tax=Gamsiella multidivaricata TaxID=101098 RepID=UPI00221E5984|nr:uncharacterized protein BC939DRAFT_251781 [Gamsiella multidivaricata]KAI7819726.1 hypothetical protein BC939DRAFT_251781 [Gamsiella multidivaricata]
MLDAYRFTAAIKTHEDIDQTRFKPSEDIFLGLEEKVLQSQPGDEAADEDMLGFDFNIASPQFRHFKAERFAVTAYQHASRSAVPFYVARKSKRNQFRPIFSDKKSILPRQSIDFSTAVSHDRLQPKAKPRVKTQKAVAKKNKKKRKKGALLRKRKGAGFANPSNPRPASATAADRRLRKLHITKALTVGSIRANIKRMDRISAAESKLLSDRLRSAVAILNAI